MRKRVVSYGEGTWFLLPITTSDFIAGVVARISRISPGILIGYFFSDVYAEKPDLSSLCAKRPAQARTAIRFGDLGLLNGEWKIVGKCDEWSSDAWPMPSFIRKNLLDGQDYEIFYDEKDPAKEMRQELFLDKDRRRLEQDGLFGYGAVQRYMAHIFGYEVPR